MARGTINETAAVIGAGVNGLTAAASLSRRGIKATVYERASAPGGLMSGAGGSIEPALFLRGPHPAALTELGLSRGALKLGPSLPTVALDPSGKPVMIEGGHLRFADGTRHPDDDAYHALSSRLDRFAKVLAPLLTVAPPRFGDWLTRAGATQLSRLARLGLDLRRLGTPDMREFLKIALANMADVLADALPDGPAAGALALDSVLGSKAGPRSPGTVIALLYRRAQGSTLHRPEGGMAGLAARLADAAVAQGAQLRYGAAVEGVEVDADHVSGLRFEDRSVERAGLALSSLGAAPTLSLAGAEHFDAETCRRIRTIRAEGVTARVDIALGALPRIPGLESATGVRLVLAPSVAALERSFNPVKYGRVSEAPAIEAIIETTGAGARLQATVQYIPYAPDADIDAEALAKLALDALEPVAPGISALASGAQALTPAQIERLTGAPGGHWHHGEIALDQLLMLRPATGIAQYETGLPGLFYCGAGAHPGGDVTGLPGRNGALAASAARASERRAA